jgi:exoribonuclease-2
MSDFDGSIWVIQDNDNLTLVCVNARIKKKIQALNERGREQSFAEDKLFWSLDTKARSADEWPSLVEHLNQRLDELSAEVDVPLLWETARELETSAIDELAELYFSGQVETVHQVALWRALALDKLYFKRRGKAWELRSPEQVEELLLQRQREEEREQLQTFAKQWLEQAVKAQTLTVDDDSAAFVEQLECWLRGDKNKNLDALLEPLADKLKQKPREVVFDILFKLGRIPADADRDLVIAGIKAEFSQPVLEAAACLQAWQVDAEQAVHELAFSIDDVDTREVDDALSIAREGDLWRVAIAISDPASIVHRGDAIDNEAMRRGTTIYLPTQTVLMMPPRVSCDIASLNAGEPRSSILIQAWLTDDGDIQRSEFHRAAITVKRRVTYDEADAVLADSAGQDDPQLRALYQLSRHLHDKRLADGALSFNRPEYKIHLHGDDIEVTVLNRQSPSRLLVAEMMILANHLAARYAQQNQLGIIYRTQDPPLEEINPDFSDPLFFYKIRRLIKPSALSLQPGQHSGLGLSLYTQLTSPLRRFADLVIQRQLVAHLNGEAEPYNQEELFKVLATAEQSAREARGLENQAKRRWFITYLQRHKTESILPVMIVENTKGGYKVEMQPWGEDAFLASTQTFEAGSTIETRLDKLRVRSGQIRLRL